MLAIAQRPIIRVGSIVICLIVIAGLTNEGVRYIAIYREMQTLEHSIQTLNDHNTQLKETLDHIGQPLFLDTVAREQLNLKREGEKVVVVSLPEHDTSIQIDTHGVNSKNGVIAEQRHWFSNIIAWWGFFFDNP